MSTKRERLLLSPPWQGGGEERQLLEALASNWLVPLGPKLAEFEAGFASALGLPHCLGTSSGTAAMHLAMELVGVGPGDVVLASTLTFIGSVSAAVHLGAELAFVDADPATWNMDPERLAEALDTLAREGVTPRAVVPTDLYGQCADYDAILAACEPYGVPVVWDAAESVGASYKGRAAGSLLSPEPGSGRGGGAAAVYSFNGNKIITTSGGGMLAAADEAFIARARYLATQARQPEPHYEHLEVGHNYRLSNLLAALGLAQLETLDERVARRRAVCDAYARELAGVPGLSFMPEADYGRGNRWLTVVLFDDPALPEAVRLALEAEDIESRPVWKPMHAQPCFAGRRTFGREVADDLFARGLCLPSGTAMTEADVARVAGVVARTVQGARA